MLKPPTSLGATSLCAGQLLRWMCALIFASGAATSTSCAQTRLPDTFLGKKDISEAYLQLIGAGAAIFNGPEYVHTYPGTTGTPFFISDHFTDGMLSYKGIIYYGVPLAYDAVSDELVVKSPQDIGIHLQPGNVDSFSVNGHLFINTARDSSASALPSLGYYEILMQGPTVVYAKRKKVAVRGLSAEDPMKFAVFSNYYLKRGDILREIRSRHDLVAVFPEHKSEIHRYLRRSHVRFRKDPEKAILGSVQQLNSITR